MVERENIVARTYVLAVLLLVAAAQQPWVNGMSRHRNMGGWVAETYDEVRSGGGDAGEGARQWGKLGAMGRGKMMGQREPSLRVLMPRATDAQHGACPLNHPRTRTSALPLVAG